jgi:hypothetical protein
MESKQVRWLIFVNQCATLKTNAFFAGQLYEKLVTKFTNARNEREKRMTP